MTRPSTPAALEPAGFTVTADSGDRIHFLDWGADDTTANDGAGAAEAARPPVLLVHGLAGTAWVWAPVARRLTAAGRRVVALDLRGHGLSDAPTGVYEPTLLAADVAAVADGAGLIDGDDLVLAGHGFGAIVAAWAAASAPLSRATGRLVLVDGGWEDVAAISGMEPDEFLRTLDEPPAILRSMSVFLADRRAFEPASWDDDQERAARASVVETAAGRVVPATRPHALAACVGAMFAYRPAETLPAVTAPMVALVAGGSVDAETALERDRALEVVQASRLGDGHPPIDVVRFPDAGHNLMRYRPDEVTAAIAGR